MSFLESVGLEADLREPERRLKRVEDALTELQLLVSVMLGGRDINTAARALGKHVKVLREEQAVAEAVMQARGLLKPEGGAE